MPDIEIGYKGSTIASMSSSGILTLSTAGKYCEDNITIDYIRPAMQVVETLDPNGGTIVTITGDVVKDGWETTPEELAQQLVERTISGSVYGSMVLSLKGRAFTYCNITEASFPECMYIGDNAFQYCSNLTNISFPKCINISSAAFYCCSNLTAVIMPNCIQVGIYAFSDCTNLSIVSLQNCVSINGYAFYNCSNLTSVFSPNCSIIGQQAFYSCSNLASISFLRCTSIGTSAFYDCRKLESIYFMGNFIASLGSYAFNNTPITNSTYLGYYGSIYVPSSLLTSYKAATNWTALSNRIFGV